MLMIVNNEVVEAEMDTFLESAREMVIKSGQPRYSNDPWKSDRINVPLSLRDIEQLRVALSAWWGKEEKHLWLEEEVVSYIIASLEFWQHCFPLLDPPSRGGFYGYVWHPTHAEIDQLIVKLASCDLHGITKVGLTPRELSHVHFAIREGPNFRKRPEMESLWQECFYGVGMLDEPTLNMLIWKFDVLDGTEIYDRDAVLHTLLDELLPTGENVVWGDSSDSEMNSKS